MTDRYATNAFVNFSQFEAGVFSSTDEQKVRKTDNPAFIWPSNERRIASGNFNVDKDGKPIAGPHYQKVKRGYMRMLSQGFGEGSTLSKRRLHFQFNPDSITRSVTARNDIQMWMNQNPVQMTQAIPGDANFHFELFFNREAEVVSGAYRAGTNGPIVPSTVEAQLPGISKAKTVSQSAVTDIGVLADLMVFDEIIGQGVNADLVASMVTNIKKANRLARNTAAARQTNEPTTPATAIATVENGKITKVDVENSGAGYVVAPTITFISENGKGAKAVASFANGKITKISVTASGSGYSEPVIVSFTGGGGGSTGSATADAQDQIPAEFDEKQAGEALKSNFGNSAFLVSLPVRIVFSSLFMVEGFITATDVTFNKFNPNMVPTQCTVSVMMQALYIGFAKEKTFLTESLKKALETDVPDETEATTQQIKQDAKGIKSISQNLFKKVGEYKGSGWNLPGLDFGFGLSKGHPNSKMSAKRAFNNGTYFNGFGLRFYPTDAFIEELKKKTINKVIVKGTFVVTYKGNTGSPSGTKPVGTTMTFKMTPTEMNTGNLSTGADSVQIHFELEDAEEKLATGESFDETETSLWDMNLTLSFGIESSLGNTNIEGTQVMIAKTEKPVAWDEVLAFHEFDVLIPAGK